MLTVANDSRNGLQIEEIKNRLPSGIVCGAFQNGGSAKKPQKVRRVFDLLRKFHRAENHSLSSRL